MEPTLGKIPTGGTAAIVVWRSLSDTGKRQVMEFANAITEALRQERGRLEDPLIEPHLFDPPAPQLSPPPMTIALLSGPDLAWWPTSPLNPVSTNKSLLLRPPDAR